MCRPEWPETWVKYPKHRKATPASWDSGEARRWSAQNNSQSQYNPFRFGTDEDVEELERRCLRNGDVIKNSDRIMTFYLETHDNVGMCAGELTSIVYVEWLASGEFHGRPISSAELHRKLKKADQ